MFSNLEKQLAKRGELSKKEVSEIIKTLESEIRVKMEAAFLDARHSVMEHYES